MKIIKTAFTAILSVLFIASSCMAIINITEKRAMQDIRRYYPETAVITEIHRESNTIVFTCSNGNVFWYTAEPEDWMPGDFCSLLMHDNDTKNVRDDRIIKVQYAGFLELYERLIP